MIDNDDIMSLLSITSITSFTALVGSIILLACSFVGSSSDCGISLSVYNHGSFEYFSNEPPVESPTVIS
jgi:hypothetical protein